MTEALQWIAESGERITVIGLLLLIVFVLVFGVQKKQRWWVPGWMYVDCQEEVTALKAELKAEVLTATNSAMARIDELEELLQRPPPRPRRPRKSP